MRIELLATYVPEARLSVNDILADAGASARDADGFAGLFGMHSVSIDQERLAPATHLLRLLDSFGQLADELRPDTLLFVHAQPLADVDALPDAARLRERHTWLAGICHVLELDQYNCAGIFYAAQTAERLIASGMSRRVLIFAGDSFAAWRPRHRYIPGCTLLGDAYAAVLISGRYGGMRLDDVRTDYYSEFAGGLNADQVEMRLFHTRHSELIAKTLASIDALSDSVGIVLPHNINGLAWRLYSRRAQIPADRVRLDLVADIGHCCTTDPLLLLDRHVRAKPAAAPINASLISIGMGGFAGAARVTGQ